MAIDHGLGGKNHEKSKQKRIKKAKRIQAICKSSQTRKKEVFFDENSRVEWLTGFRKRKQERRKFGLAMELLKKKRVGKDQVKERKLIMESQVSISHNTDESDDVDRSDGDTAENTSDGEPVVFDDSHTQTMFGGCVSVTVDTSIADQLNDHSGRSSIDDEQRTSRRKENNGFASKLAKAMKIVKSTMNQRKPKRPKSDTDSKGKKGGKTFHALKGGDRTSGGRIKKR